MSGSDIVTYLILIGIVAGTIGWWKIFTKADEAGWKATIPIYNAIVGLRIAGRPWWWVLRGSPRHPLPTRTPQRPNRRLGQTGNPYLRRLR